MTISYADLYSQSQRERRAMVEFMAKYAALAVMPHPALKVLDFGCGRGYLLEALHQRSIPCEGIDICPDQVQLSQAQGLAASHVEDSLAWLATSIGRGQQWNSIFLLDVLEHLSAEAQLHALELFHKALPHGGKLVIKVPNPDSVAGLRMACRDFTHRFTPTADALEDALRAMAYSSIELTNEIPWATQTFGSTFSLLLGTREERKRFRYDIFYLLSQPLFRWLRRLALASEVGLETAFRTPLSPNYLCIATK